MVFHGSRLIFHGSRSVCHDSRSVFHGSRSVFMAFHCSRWVFLDRFSASLSIANGFGKLTRFFMVPRGFLWYFMVPGRFLLVFHGLGGLLWLFMVPGQFFEFQVGFSWFQVGFYEYS